MQDHEAAASSHDFAIMAVAQLLFAAGSRSSHERLALILRQSLENSKIIPS
jgi:hypothetical protein